jgi:hypothetical protein
LSDDELKETIGAAASTGIAGTAPIADMSARLAAAIHGAARFVIAFLPQSQSPR